MPTVYGPEKMKILPVKNEYSLIRKMLGYIYWASEDPVFALVGEVNRANYARVIYQSRIYFSVRDLLELMFQNVCLGTNSDV